MNTKELIRQYREMVREEQREDSQWGDHEIVGYLNMAERDACRRSNCLISEDVEGITQLNIASGVKWITLDPRILYVYRAWWDDGLLQAMQTNVIDVLLDHWEDDIGTPVVNTLDGDKIALYPRPAESGTLRLRASHMPQNDMQLSDMDTEGPEIPEALQPALVFGALSYGFLKQDSQTFDEQASERFEAEFAKVFGPPITAQDVNANRNGLTHLERKAAMANRFAYGSEDD